METIHYNTLLITWTINPNNGKKHKSSVLSNEHYFDPTYREKEYLSTIIYYITKSNFSRITFCENSNYDIREWNTLEVLAKKFWKELELLQFNWNKDNISKYSYHYWEAEIFDYAFKNSVLLKKSDKFFKATWRYIIYNINELINDYKDTEYFFYKWFWLNSTLCINTAFFMTSKKIYEKYLYKKMLEYYEIHCINWKNFIALEWVFYELLKDFLFKEPNKIIDFPFFHFFSAKTIITENIKLRLWLLWFWSVWKIIDIIVPKIKQFISFFYHKK